MFLKSLTLKGFKSFADPVTLSLEPGVTVVVGPNGSGKSNVVDSIAWVLGAQGPRALRGSKMEDVIFAGSSDRPALGRAEVALTIDNRAGRLPGGLAEITITRTLFRSGESEYAINGQPCRLLDIQELLSDSGVGRTQHLIVGQGQLDQILNARPEDRRAVIEEAAGVLKHRRRRERAERRLAAADENLERLADLIRELRRQIRPLEKQASAARSYGRLTEELRALRLFLAGRELVSLNDRLRTAASSREQLQREAAQLRDELAQIDSAIEQATAELSSRDDEDLVTGLGRTQGLVERCVGLASLLGERRRSLERALAAAADVDVVSSLESDAARLTEELGQTDTAVGELRSELAILASQEAELLQEGRTLETLPDQSEVRSAREAQAMAGARLDAVQKALDLDRDHLRRLTESRQVTNARLQTLLREQEELKDELGTIATRIADLSARKVDADADLENAEHRLKQAEEHAIEAGRRQDRAEVRAESLASALRELKGSDGLKTLSGAAGVLGSLEDLVEVEDDFEDAFEAAIMTSLESVVVDGRHMTNAVALLRAQRVAGTLLPTKSVTPTFVSPTNAFHSPAGPLHGGGLVNGHGNGNGNGNGNGMSRGDGAGTPTVPSVEINGAEPLLSHVRTSVAQVQKLLDALLADAYVVSSGWERAAEIALEHPELVILTADGDRFSKGGWTVGAAARGLTPAAVVEARRLAIECQEEVASQKAVVHAAREGVVEAKRAVATAQTNLSVVESRRNEAQRSVDQSAAVARTLEDEIAKDDVEKTGLDARIRSGETDLEQLRSEVAHLSEVAAETARNAAEAEAVRAEFAQRRSSLVDRRNDVQVRAGAAAERRQVLGSRLVDVERRLAGHAEERSAAEERRRRIESDTLAVERLGKVVEAHRVRVESVAAQLQELRDRQVELLRAGGARLEDLRRRRIATDERISNVRDGHQKCDIELAEVGARHQAASEALERELDSTPEDALNAECPDLDEGMKPAQRASQLQSELQKMGPINPLAAEELSALEERNEFLEREVDDVRRARRELQQVIRTVDDEIARLFAEAFADVDRHFQVLVASMFPGGAGRLSLTEPTDALGTGVELEARPAGKQVRKLSLLSGGERSLVALAFLFAVFRSRPSPFYVLDEVEAALDDVNLHRFLGLLHEFRDEAQLLVVSHQKRTMESADALYGVTMTPGGSSKVVSQKVKGHKPFEQRRSAHPVAETV
ncbi:MAG: AAA family ATPase [Acidimicrobiales bacterium]